MKILIIGGTRFFGKHTVKALLEKGHEVYIATRGITADEYGDRVKRIIIERTDASGIKEALGGVHYDVVIDKIAYCSNDIRYVMDAVDCDKYIHMSTTAVYAPKHLNTKEDDFDGCAGELIWCDRDAFTYEQIKRQAEYALWQKYPDRKWIAVRYPFAVGPDDYTERLLFYVEHVIKSIPMHIDNLENQMGFIRSDEAGEFMAFLADKEFSGAINGSAEGTISLKEIIDYIEQKTGRKAIISADGEAAPYNGEPEYSINTEKARALGFQFSVLHDWIFALLDYYIKRTTC
ncbi:MAG: NAD-dependent epimerase/dehydratase family protein [Lachnospiraceae bacterium]|nr:NAD-dependent epimerase/dehydratase family protein [Lachnospiraceae bacterium]